MERNERALLEEAERECMELGKILRASMPKGWAFTFIMWSKEDKDGAGFGTYVSNTERATTVQGLREMADQIEMHKEI